MYAGGTATTPRTTRVGRQVYEPPGSRMLLHVTGAVPDGAAEAV
jgi:hypothetical protein